MLLSIFKNLLILSLYTLLVSSLPLFSILTFIPDDLLSHLSRHEPQHDSIYSPLPGVTSEEFRLLPRKKDHDEHPGDTAILARKDKHDDNTDDTEIVPRKDKHHDDTSKAADEVHEDLKELTDKPDNGTNLFTLLYCIWGGLVLFAFLSFGGYKYWVYKRKRNGNGV